MKPAIRLLLTACPLALAAFWAADRGGWADVAFSHSLRPGMAMADVDWVMGTPLLHSTDGRSTGYTYPRVSLIFGSDGTLRSVSR